MEEPFRIDWSTLGELNDDELLGLLHTANEELKRLAYTRVVRRLVSFYYRSQCIYKKYSILW